DVVRVADGRSVDREQDVARLEPRLRRETVAIKDRDPETIRGRADRYPELVAQDTQPEAGGRRLALQGHRAIAGPASHEDLQRPARPARRQRGLERLIRVDRRSVDRNDLVPLADSGAGGGGVRVDGADTHAARPVFVGGDERLPAEADPHRPNLA